MNLSYKVNNSQLQAMIIARQYKILSLPIGKEQMYRARFYITEQYYKEYKHIIDEIGFTEKQIRIVPLNSHFQICTSTLEEMIQNDFNFGLWPFFILASVGSPLMGAIDNLKEISSIADQFNCWMHLDARNSTHFYFHHLLGAIEEQFFLANSISFSIPDEMNECIQLNDHKKDNIQYEKIKIEEYFKFKERENYKKKLEIALDISDFIQAEQHLELLYRPKLSKVLFRINHRLIQPEALNRVSRELFNLLRMNLKHDTLIPETNGFIYNGQFLIQLCTMAMSTKELHFQEVIDLIRWGKIKILHKMNLSLGGSIQKAQ